MAVEVLDGDHRSFWLQGGIPPPTEKPLYGAQDLAGAVGLPMLVAALAGELDNPGGPWVFGNEAFKGGAGGCIGEVVKGGPDGVDGQLHEPLVGVCGGLRGGARLTVGAGRLGLKGAEVVGRGVADVDEGAAWVFKKSQAAFELLNPALGLACVVEAVARSRGPVVEGLACAVPLAHVEEGVT